MSFESLMEELSREYIAELPQKIQTIRQQLESGVEEEIRNSFHKLKGTGKTYGLPEVSQIGEALEEICTHHTQAIPETVPLALDLLNTIYQNRQQGHPTHIESDPRFKSILKQLRS